MKGCDETKVEEGNKDKAMHNSLKGVRGNVARYSARKRITDCWLKIRMLKYVLKEYDYFRRVVDGYQELIKNSHEI